METNLLILWPAISLTVKENDKNEVKFSCND
jgi:hypothetical protein